MKTRKLFRILLMVLTALSLLFTACGNSGYYEEDDWVEVEEPDVEVEDEDEPEAGPVEVEDPPEDEEAADEEENEVDTESSGTIIAHSGFDVSVDGFDFANYDYTETLSNLTSDEMRRLFGEDVCSYVNDGECILTPLAWQWMRQVNDSMMTGHAEGMAVLSALIYYGGVSPEEFADNPELLQREIAYWYATQVTYPDAAPRVNDSPSAVLETLIADLNAGLEAEEWWTLGLYPADFSHGHALTPFAVEEDGEGIYHILVYDSNYPQETRYVEVDSNAETWSYEGAAGLYEGDAESATLEAIAISPRLQEQECPFCPGAETYELWLLGPGDLHIALEDERLLGYSDGEFVNEVTGATVRHLRAHSMSEDGYISPVYRIPVREQRLDLTVNGSRLEENVYDAMTLFGPGFFVAVEEITVLVDSDVPITIDIKNRQPVLTCYIAGGEEPALLLGGRFEERDYVHRIQVSDVEAGSYGAAQAIVAAVDLDTGELSLGAPFLNETYVNLDIAVLFAVDGVQYAFGQENLGIRPSEMAYVPLQEWGGPGDVIFHYQDEDVDGFIDFVTVLSGIDPEDLMW